PPKNYKYVDLTPIYPIYTISTSSPLFTASGHPSQPPPPSSSSPYHLPITNRRRTPPPTSSPPPPPSRRYYHHDPQGFVGCSHDLKGSVWLYKTNPGCVGFWVKHHRVRRFAIQPPSGGASGWQPPPKVRLVGCVTAKRAFDCYNVAHGAFGLTYTIRLRLVWLKTMNRVRLI
nr:hypothetical protein [Tanacetum cinerariifolium]